MIPHFSFVDPSDAFNISPKGSPTCPIFHSESVYEASFEDTGSNHSYPHYRKA
jgi:hypothetical protein